MRVDKTRRHRTRPRAATLLGALTLVASLVGAATESVIPAKLQVQLFLKILSFDRNFGAAAEDGVTIAVLVQRRYRPALDSATDFLDAVETIDEDAFTGARVEAIAIEFESMEELEEGLVALQPDCVFVPPLRALDLSRLAAIARREGIRTLTGVPQYLERGLSVGLGVRDDRPEIRIHLSAARAEGADFSSQLLSVARVTP
ncbi:MAG: hypothetical protein AMXMBFR36_11230 [Acidobacteriota bacterium]